MLDNRYISILQSQVQDKSIRTLLTLTAVSIASTFIPQLMLVGLLLSVAIWACFFTPLRIFRSLFSRLIVSFLFLTCIQQIIGLLFWMLDLRLTLPWLIFFQGSTLVVYCLAGNKKALKPSPFINRTDIMASLVGIIGPALLFFSILSGGSISQRLLQFFSTGFDNTAHLSLTLSNYDNQGLVYGEQESVIDKVVFGGFNVYPQGWHLNNAMVLRSVFPGGLSTQTDLTRIMASYFIIVAAWFFIVMYLFSLTCAELTRTVSRKELGYFELLIVALFSLFVQSLSITSLVRFGFGNFLPQITYLLLLILLGIGLCRDRDRNNRNLPSYIFLGLLLCSGMALSWMLTAAIGFSIVFLTAYASYGKGLGKFILYLVRPKLLIPSLLLLIAPAIQVALWLIYGGVNDHLNASGGIEPLNRNVLLIFTFAACLIYLFGKFKEISHMFMSTLIGVLSLSGVVYAYQLFSSEFESYYSIKLAHLALILLAVFVGGALAYSVRNIKRDQLLLGTLFAFSLLLFLPQAMGVNVSSWGYLRGNFRSLSTYSASQILQLLDTEKDYQPHIIIYKELDYEEDVVTTHFVRMLSRTNTQCQSATFNSIVVRDEKTLLSQINNCTEQENMSFHIIASGQNFDDLTTFFKDNQHVNTILSN